MDSKKPLKTFTREDVARHNKDSDLYTIIDSVVYDISKFVDLHPGGAAVLLDADVAGKDTTELFFGLHRSDVLQKYKRLAIGRIEGESPSIAYPTP